MFFVLSVEIATIFEPKLSGNSFRTSYNEKIGKLCKSIFSTHYNIFQQNFGILLLLKGSFREFRFYCLDQKLVYNANCLLENH